MADNFERRRQSPRIPGYDWVTSEQTHLLSELLEGFRNERQYQIWAHKVKTYCVPEREAPGLKILASPDGLIPRALLNWPDGPMKQEVTRTVTVYLISKGFRRESHKISPPEAEPLKALPGVRELQRAQ